jgi:hypothetical protein
MKRLSREKGALWHLPFKMREIAQLGERKRKRKERKERILERRR